VCQEHELSQEYFTNAEFVSIGIRRVNTSSIVIGWNQMPLAT
jgi:hypothetical protein